ncbi:hypothetical protein WJX81_000851 [Elliptochloris bilobata]|uniref:Galactose oxidase n=1 Tax=Elliptochloris bilobata TaxID=381761 RepID=A0AAW1RZS7_9CHLO
MAGSASSLSWQEIALAPEDRPALPRSGHCMVALPAEHADDVLLFGGYTEDSELNKEAANDAWVLRLAEGRWQRVQYADGPVPRVRLAAAAAVVGDTMWLMAGWDPGHKRDGGEILADLWALDLSTWAWRQVQPQGEAMPVISRFQAVVIGPSVYIHTHRSLLDILVLDVADPAAPKLALRPVTGTEGTPMSRGLHSMTATASGHLILFAGAPKSGPMLGDLWGFDPASTAWEELDPDGQAPHVRCSQAAAAVGDDVFFFGGSYYKEDQSGLQPLSDTLVLDTQSMTWQYPRVTGGAAPSPRNAAMMVAVGSRLVLHGGWYPFKQSYNDTYVMDVGGYDAMRSAVSLEPEEPGFADGAQA